MTEPDCAICEDGAVASGTLHWWQRGFIVCPECGNKRCPKASAHWLECTGSNDPGQPGSFYGPKEFWPKEKP